MGTNEREETIFHGTTHQVAQRIYAQKAFEIRETYFASDRVLAEFFALRSSAKQGRGDRPVALKVVLYESDLKEWKRNKLVHSSGFSEGDRPELRGKSQLIFSAEAVRLLNAYMFSDDLAIEMGSHDG